MLNCHNQYPYFEPFAHQVQTLKNQKNYSKTFRNILNNAFCRIKIKNQNNRFSNKYSTTIQSTGGESPFSNSSKVINSAEPIFLHSEGQYNYSPLKSSINKKIQKRILYLPSLQKQNRKQNSQKKVVIQKQMNNIVNRMVITSRNQWLKKEKVAQRQKLNWERNKLIKSCQKKSQRLYDLDEQFEIEPWGY